MRAIACVDMNGGIGYKNNLLYRLSDDLRVFKAITINNGCVIMGNNTFKSIGSKPLQDRANIVICKDKTLVFDTDGNLKIWHFSNIALVSQLFPQAIVIGGEQIYKLFEPYIDYIYLTEVLDDVKQADTYFPLMDKVNNMAQLIVSQFVATDKRPAYNISIYIDKIKWKEQIDIMVASGEYIYNIGVEYDNE